MLQTESTTERTAAESTEQRSGQQNAQRGDRVRVMPFGTDASRVTGNPVGMRDRVASLDSPAASKRFPQYLHRLRPSSASLSAVESVFGVVAHLPRAGRCVPCNAHAAATTAGTGTSCRTTNSRRRPRNIGRTVIAYCTENLKIVVEWKCCPGFSSVEGKLGWFGESGKCWVSRQNPLRKLYTAPPLPLAVPSRKFPL